MKKILLLIIFLCIGCSYKPIYSNSDQLNFDFNKIIITGDKNIKRQILNNLANISKNINSNKELIINIIYKIEETSRDTKGQVETYRTVIMTEIIINENKQILKKENFLNEFSYNNKDNRYELKLYQQQIRNNLVNDLLNEITLFLKFL